LASRLLALASLLRACLIGEFPELSLGHAGRSGEVWNLALEAGDLVAEDEDDRVFR